MQRSPRRHSRLRVEGAPWPSQNPSCCSTPTQQGPPVLMARVGADDSLRMLYGACVYLAGEVPRRCNRALGAC